MTVKRALDPQFDLFVPFVADLPLRDQRETMERPFFSLAKRKRLQAIRYVSPDDGVYRHFLSLRDHCHVPHCAGMDIDLSQ